MFPLKRDQVGAPATPPPMQQQKSDNPHLNSCKRRNSMALEPQSVSRAAIKRLARRAGVKRVGLEFFPDAETCLRRFLGSMVKDIGIITEHARRRTVTVGDVLLVLKRHGRTLYGFEEKQRKRRLTQRLAPHSLADAASRVVSGAACVRGAQTTPRADGEARTPAASQKAPLLSHAAAPQAAAEESAERPNGALAGKARPPTTTPMTSGTGQPGPSSTPEAPVTPDRAQEIQLSLSTFRDCVLERQNLGSSPLTEAREWVGSELIRRGKAPCSATEFDIVIDALDQRNAIMVDGQEGQRVLYFM